MGSLMIVKLRIGITVHRMGALGAFENPSLNAYVQITVIAQRFIT